MSDMDEINSNAIALARSYLAEQQARIAELEAVLRKVADLRGIDFSYDLDALDEAIELARTVLNKETNRPASLPSTPKPFTGSSDGCVHDWHIWPETDGREQRCFKCGMYRETPRA